MEITRGDLLITADVLRTLIRATKIDLEEEIKSGDYEYDNDCPSYVKFHSLIDSLVAIDKNKI